MRSRIPVILGMVLYCMSPRTVTAVGASDLYPGKHWSQIARPEDAGWSTQKLARARAFADSIDTAAVIIVDHGQIISQWGSTQSKYNVHSVRKSLLSGLYGIAVSKGAINPNSTRFITRS